MIGTKYGRIISDPLLTMSEKANRIALQLGLDQGDGAAQLFTGAVIHYRAFGEETACAEDPRTKEIWSAFRSVIDADNQRHFHKAGEGSRTEMKRQSSTDQKDTEEHKEDKSLLADIIFDPNSIVRDTQVRRAAEGGRQYVSDVIDMTELKSGKLNLIIAPPGSGKTTFIEGPLKEYARQFSQELLYLAPTRSIVDALKFRGTQKTITLRDGSKITRWEQSGITAMTYASFGYQIALREKEGTYRLSDWWHDDSLICLDELSDAVRYAHYPSIINYTKLALDELVTRCKNDTNMTVAIGATPKIAIKYFYFWNKAEINLVKSTLGLKGYENGQTIEYTDLDKLLNSLDKNLRGMIYIRSIDQINRAIDVLDKRGIHAVGIWASTNREKPMDNAQREVAESIVRDEKIPDDVQVLIFNAAYETGINIKPEKSHLDYIVVHNTNEDVVIQARGRYRGDIGTLYRKTNLDGSEMATRELDASIISPYLGRRLNSKEKRSLVDSLHIKDGRNRKAGWPTVSKQLEKSGYIVTEGRSGSRWWMIRERAEE